MDEEDTGLTRRRMAQSLIAASLVPPAAFAQQAESDTNMSHPTALALARILNKPGFRDLPPEAIQHAKMIVASTLASAAAGRGIGSVHIVRELAEGQGGKPEATVW